MSFIKTIKKQRQLDVLKKCEDKLWKLYPKIHSLYGELPAKGFLVLTSSSCYADPKWAYVIATETAVIKTLLKQYNDKNTLFTEVVKKCNEVLKRNFKTIQLEVHGDYENMLRFLSTYDPDDFYPRERHFLDEFFKNYSKVVCHW